MKNNKDRVSFFENIYYWLWYSMPKPQQYGDEPAPFIGFLVSVLLIFNGMFIVILVGSLLNTTMRGSISHFLLGDFKWILILILISLGLVLTKYTDRYAENFKSISDKISRLSPRQRSVKILTFFFYIIFSVGLLISIPYFNI